MEQRTRSKVEIYLHVVWSTFRRQPFIDAGLRRAVYDCVNSQVERHGCQLLAIGGIEDHVHILIRVPATVDLARIVKYAKGVSSRLIGESVGIYRQFRWQAGYGAFSVSRSHVGRVVHYINHQREHHADGTIWPDWEETRELVLTDSTVGSTGRREATPRMSAGQSAAQPQSSECL